MAQTRKPLPKPKTVRFLKAPWKRSGSLSSPLSLRRRLRVPSPSRTLQAIRLSCAPPSPSAAPEAASLQTKHSCAKSLPQGSVFPRSRRFWWKNVSPAGKRSNLRSCATAMETSSRSALWKILIRWVSTPATPSLSPLRSPLLIKNIRCFEVLHSTSSKLWALRAAATYSLL